MIRFKVLKSKTSSIENISQTVDRIICDYYEAHSPALPPAGVYDLVIREVEKPLIKRALVATKGNQLRAAELLGINRNTLHKKIKDLGIEVK